MSHDTRPDIGRRVKRFVALNPQPWAIWAAARTVVAGAVVGAIALPFGGDAASVAYFAVACATSFSVLGRPSQRVGNTAGQAAGAALGLLLAGLTTGSPVAIALLAIVAGFASGVTGRLRSGAVTAGSLMLLVALAFGTFAHSSLTVAMQILWYLIGSAIVAVLAALPVGRSLDAAPPAQPAGETWRQSCVVGARLALCFGVGMIVATLLDQGRHSYWLPLTVAVVVRSEYGPVTNRVASRIAGTLIGAVLATAVVMTHPSDLVLAAAAVVGMAFGALAVPRHYGISVVGITLSALLSGEIGLQERIIPVLRLGDTLLGCLIALVLGHLIWLRHRRTEEPSDPSSP